MKILDIIFYIVLCACATLAFFIYNMHTDLYFPASNVDNSYSFANFEKDSIDVALKNVDSINLSKLSNERYLLSFFRQDSIESSKDSIESSKNFTESSKEKSGLFGVLFSPNKYSTQDSNGKWQNVAINAKSWGNLKLLADNSSLFSNTRQIVSGFDNPILQTLGERLFLFVNGRNFEGFNTEKIYVFESKISDILEFLSTESTENNVDSNENIESKVIESVTLEPKNNAVIVIDDKSLNLDSKNIESKSLESKGELLSVKDSKNPNSEDSKKLENLELIDTKNTPKAPFRFYKKITLGALFNLNFLLSSNALSINLNSNAENFILPLYSMFFYPTSLFAIFDSKFHLKEMLRPNTQKNLYKPLITSVAQYENDVNLDSSINHISRACVAVFHNYFDKKLGNLQDSIESNSLHFQPCEAINGVINFSELTTSKNITDISELSLATLGSYTILVYLDSKRKNLNLAIFEGSDFKFITTLDSSSINSFFSPNIIINGTYAYITYGDKAENKIHILTINDAYIKNIINKKD